MTVSNVGWEEALRMPRSVRAAFIQVFIQQNPRQTGDGASYDDDD